MTSELRELVTVPYRCRGFEDDDLDAGGGERPRHRQSDDTGPDDGAFHPLDHRRGMSAA